MHTPSEQGLRPCQVRETAGATRTRPRRVSKDLGIQAPRHTKTYQDIPRHTKTYQDIPRHTKTYQDILVRRARPCHVSEKLSLQVRSLQRSASETSATARLSAWELSHSEHSEPLPFSPFQLGARKLSQAATQREARDAQSAGGGRALRNLAKQPEIPNPRDRSLPILFPNRSDATARA